MNILTEREKTHGPFLTTAAKAQQLKDAMQGGKNWDELGDVQREALQMIASKVARILSGNCAEIDHWRDIAGYANLVVQEIARLNSYIVYGMGPTHHPDEHSLGTPSPVPASFAEPGTAGQP